MDLPYDATGGPERREALGPNGFLVGPDPTSGALRHRGSRWSGDAITLSRWSRILMTGVLFLPVVWMIFFMGLGGVLFLALYSFLFLPVALRDVWRRTRITVPPLPPASRAP